VGNIPSLVRSSSQQPDAPIEALPVEEKYPDGYEPPRENGKFVKGYSGNPAGRTKGIRNKITLERLLLEDSLRQCLAERSPALLEKAIDMALEGNDRVMRALLDKVLSTPKHDDPGEAKDNEIKILIQNLTNSQTPASERGLTTVKVTPTETEVSKDDG